MQQDKTNFYIIFSQFKLTTDKTFTNLRNWFRIRQCGKFKTLLRTFITNRLITLREAGRLVDNKKNNKTK